MGQSLGTSIIDEGQSENNALSLSSASPPLSPSTLALPYTIRQSQYPTFAESFITTIIEPFNYAIDAAFGKPYILCALNRCGASYRSPWSNNYEPHLSFLPVPQLYLRRLEIDANFAFDHYYEGGFSSVYAIQLGTAFAMIVILKKENLCKDSLSSWETVHVFEVQENDKEKIANYKLQSKTFLWTDYCSGVNGDMQLGGSITHQMERDARIKLEQPHIDVFGEMVDDMERKIRKMLTGLCQFDKIEAPKIQNRGHSKLQ